MNVIKCDICGAECPDWKQARQVQIRRLNSMYDTRLSLEKSLDVCMSCINDIFEGGTKCEKTQEAADDKG